MSNNNKEKYEARVFEVASIIKIVCTMDIESVCTVATNIMKHYSEDKLDTLDNHCVYDAYCTCRGDSP